MVAGCLFAVLPLLANEPPAIPQARAEELEELEAVVVYGGYATPQMWKVSKGDHVMWVLNIGEPPRPDVRWRSKELEARVAESQLVLFPPGLDNKSNLGSLPNDVYRYPGKGTLKDELPKELYQRWRALKDAYFPRNDDVERLRPIAAMGTLEGMLMNLEAMIPPPQAGPGLRQLVDEAAKKHKVKVQTAPTVSFRSELTRAEQEMVHMNDVRELGDMECFTRYLDYIERLVAHRKQQAYATRQSYAAWLEVRNCPLRRLTSGDFPDPAAARSAYDKLMLRDELIEKELDAAWMVAAQAALEQNKSTFAVVYTKRPQQYPILSREFRHGYMARFRELGCEVEEPDRAVE
jgi:hypothetical protein